MTNSTKNRMLLAYEHDGEVRHASVELFLTKASITFNGLPSIEFEVSFNDPEKVVLALPTDRKGRKPTVSCDIASIPELESAMGEVRKQGWLCPKVCMGESA